MKTDREINMENKKRPTAAEMQDILGTVNKQFDQALNKLAAGVRTENNEE